jgi:hypothetical protein
VLSAMDYFADAFRVLGVLAVMVPTSLWTRSR